MFTLMGYDTLILALGVCVASRREAMPKALP